MKTQPNQSHPSRLQPVSGDTLLLIVSVLTGFLPLILVTSVAWFFTWDTQQPTLSEYVYTSANPFFIGIVFSLGIVLICYHGYDQSDAPLGMSDRQLTTLAGWGCVITAIFPSNTCAAIGGPEINAFQDTIWGQVHIMGALLSYFPMALFVIFNFTQTGGTPFDELSKRKIWSNRVYRICGGVMLACLFFIILKTLIAKITNAPLCPYFHEIGPTFYAETLMQSAVSIAWLTKFMGRKLSQGLKAVPN